LAPFKVLAQADTAKYLAFSSLEHENMCAFENKFASLIVKSDCEPQDSTLVILRLNPKNGEL
jgi:hypothetical protein